MVHRLGRDSRVEQAPSGGQRSLGCSEVPGLQRDGGQVLAFFPAGVFEEKLLLCGGGEKLGGEGQPDRRPAWWGCGAGQGCTLMEGTQKRPMLNTL